MIDIQNPTKTDEVVKRNVSMFAHNWALVDEINDRFDFGNTSSALRYIINEYMRLTAQENERLQAD